MASGLYNYTDCGQMGEILAENRFLKFKVLQTGLIYHKRNIHRDMIKYLSVYYYVSKYFASVAVKLMSVCSEEER